jgi:hypothetical protein
MSNGVSNLMGNIVITLAGGFLLLGGPISVAILSVYAFAVVMVRRLSR